MQQDNGVGKKGRCLQYNKSFEDPISPPHGNTHEALPAFLEASWVKTHIWVLNINYYSERE